MNTVDKTPEQIDFDEKMKKVITETPESNWYHGSFSGVSKTAEQIMKEWQSKPWVDYEERQLLPEPDYKLVAATEAGKIPHSTIQEYLSDCDKIYNWFVEKHKRNK